MTGRVGFISLGCPKNLVDSERILTQLRTDGYEVVPSYDEADLVIVNTCGFIDSAVEESLETIGEALKENGKVLVTGCLGAQDGVIRTAHPDVLAITGPHQYEAVLGQVREHLPPPPAHDPFVDLVPAQGVKLTPRHYAYLKISEGCNHRCSFCIIPSMRGDLVSRSAGDVLGEAERLVEAGVQELLVVSQDTSAYGVDIRYKTGFWGGKPVKSRLMELCEAMGSLGAWVRLHYVYPYPSVDKLIPLMQDGLILPYLDIPLQHASPRILKAMRRPAAAEKSLERIQKWRAACPDLTLRSTFIVGFPGETEQEFEQLLQFLRDAELDRVGCFPYSPVEGATANALPGAIPEALRHERYEAFMHVQQGISAQRLARKVGQEIEVLIDDFDEQGDAIARSQGDAPEIDGHVFISGAEGLHIGQRLQVEVTDADDYDLYGVPVLDW